MIKLPALFEEKLKDAPSLGQAIRKTFDLFEPWLEQSGMPFFPGFTDHSPRHITDVLNTAASLISDSSHDLLSAEDIAVLSMAILLHDSGMHLTQDGFRALASNSSKSIVADLGDLPWAQLWKDFLSEAYRFGQEKLIAIFGDADPLIPGELDLENLSERDCLLIGEFVRRHHTRLAHEIAITGVPNRSGSRLALIGFDEEIKDLAGLVARSHGMSIRETFPYISSRFGLLPEYRNVKTPFLMAVLRIADYVQVKSERAIQSLLSVKELRSPISRQEWLNHFAVKDISTQHDDPEALYVHATPLDVRTYLKLDWLFKDIQRELDESWGTLGEVYGRRGTLSSLGLTIRRIRSNLDSKEKFSKSVPYIPIKASFQSSGPELLKLLVGPLYNYEYKVGIRELVQNAVDACRERSDLNSKNEDAEDRNSKEADVLVNIEESEDGTGWITITDKGVGMTLDTVTRFFLVAGASFRNSDVWKQKHTDELGRVRVMRGGRFGVGALAAFLLGDKITVRTRHVDRSELEGLEFSAQIDDPIVELTRCSAPVGTSIKIWISNPKVFENLRPSRPSKSEISENIKFLESWNAINFFVQAKPRVLYKWNGYNKSSEQQYPEGPRLSYRAEFVPNARELVPQPSEIHSDWHALTECSPYDAVLWQYKKPRKNREDESDYTIYDQNEIVVNGIRVEVFQGYGPSSALSISRDAIFPGPQYSLVRPTMAVFDPAGLCPINLQRNNVSFERMGIDMAIAKAVFRDHFSILKDLNHPCETLADFDQFLKELGGYRGINYEGQVKPCFATSAGYFLATPAIIAKQKICTIFFLRSQEEYSRVNLSDLLRDGEGIMLHQATRGVQADLAWFRAIFSGDASHSYSYARNIGFPKIRQKAAIFAMLKEDWDFANEKGRVNQEVLRPLTSQKLGTRHILATLGQTENSQTSSRIKSILDLLPADSEIALWTLDDDQPHIDSTPMIQVIWEEMYKGREFNSDVTDITTLNTPKE